MLPDRRLQKHAHARFAGVKIHTPPPPGNQIIHAFPARLLGNVVTINPVWANGAIETGRSKTSIGGAGYRSNADMVMPSKKR